MFLFLCLPPLFFGADRLILLFLEPVSIIVFLGLTLSFSVSLLSFPQGDRLVLCQFTSFLGLFRLWMSWMIHRQRFQVLRVIVRVTDRQYMPELG